jgi:hypothetical protein
LRNHTTTLPWAPTLWYVTRDGGNRLRASLTAFPGGDARATPSR